MNKLEKWEKEAIEELKQYGQWKAADENLHDEAALLEELWKREENPEKQKEYQKQHEELKIRFMSIRIRVQRVERALSALYPRERLVLETLYIRGERPEEAQETCCCEKTLLYTTRKKALKGMIRALYGVE